jgi:hypothetical protein
MSLGPNAILALSALASFLPIPLTLWSLWSLERTKPRRIEWALCTLCFGLGIFRLLLWPTALLITCLWVAALIRRSIRKPPRDRADRALGTLELFGLTGAAVVVTWIAAFVLMFAGPRTKLERAVCASSAGAPYSLFLAKARVIGLDVMGRGPNKVTTINSWLFMHYGCELTVDDGGMVTTARMWSVG